MSKIAQIYLLAMIVVHPLFITNKYFNITESKTYFFAWAIGIALLCVLIAFCFNLIIGKTPRIDFKAAIKSIRPYEWAILAYWIIILISAATARFPQYAWSGSSDRADGFWMQTGYLASAVLIGRWYKPKKRDLLLFCGVASLVAGYAILQYYGVDPLELTPPAWHVPYGPELALFSTMSNRNMFSTYLSIVFCICIVFFSQKKEKRDWMFFAFGLICFYMLLLGETRSGYVGILAAGAIAFPFVVRDRHSAARMFLMLAACCALAYVYQYAYNIIVATEAYKEYTHLTSYVSGFAPYLPYAGALFAVLAALFHFAKIPTIPQRPWRISWGVLVVAVMVLAIVLLPTIADITGSSTMIEAAQLIQGTASSEAGSGRMFIWVRAWEIFKERPILGHGPDMFAAAFKYNYQADAQAHGKIYDKVHNEYLQILVDEGILGLLAMLAFYGALFFAMRKQLDKTPQLALATAMLCFVVQAFFNFSTPIAHPIVWAMWGFFAALTHRELEPLKVRKKATK